MSEQSEEKTFDPTPQRLFKAMQEGQVGFSSELMGAMVFLLGAIFFWMAGAWMLDAFRQSFRTRLTVFGPMTESSAMVVPALMQSIYPVMAVVAALLAVVTVVPTLAGGLQTRFNFSAKALEWKPGRMNPLKGIKKLFSASALVRLGTSLARAAVVVVMTWWILRAQIDAIVMSGMGSLEAAFGLGCQIVLLLSLGTAALMVVVGTVDLAWQKWKNHNELKMTIKEVRDEQRDNDGDPMVKARMRKMAQESMSKSLPAEVARASVVITNPTHFAVALRYDRNEAMAPVVVARGADHLAKRIIELAREFDVPVIEKKPVARFLYFRARVGQMIPVEMYMAVAEILNFVSRRRAG